MSDLELIPPRSVLFFIHSMGGGGAERATANMANYWVHKGWKVTLVTIAAEGGDCYSISPEIQRIGLGLEDDNRSPWFSLRIKIHTVGALRRILKSQQPQVAIAMMEDASILLGLASIGLAGLTIGAERTYPPKTAFAKLHWKWLRYWTYGYLNAIVTQTDESKVWIEEHTRAKKVMAVPNVLSWPLPNSNPVLIPNAIVPAGKQLLLSIGRLEHEKQYPLLIQVFERLASRFPDWVLVIVGEGSERLRLERLITEKKLETCVLLPGRAGNPADWYTAADLFVLSSAFEGFPNVLLEAMAYGKAVVSFDCKTGPSELIDHEFNGLLVEDGNAIILEQALARCMENNDLRQQLGQRATDVRITHSIDRIMKHWEGLIADFLNKK